MKTFRYTLVEFCDLTRIDEKLIKELVENGIIDPRVENDAWLFSSDAVGRCLRAMRLRQDLALDYQGVAIALELMDKNQRLKQRIQYLEHLVDRLSS